MTSFTIEQASEMLSKREIKKNISTNMFTYTKIAPKLKISGGEGLDDVIIGRFGRVSG